MAISNFIQRPNYLKQLIPFIDKQLIKVFTGLRRVGKSYMLFQIIEEIKKQFPERKILYINKESDEFFTVRNYLDLLDYIKTNASPNEKTTILIDEIQDIDQFELALRSLVIDQRFDIYCTGSNAHMFSGDLATYLSGRYIEFHIFSLSYPEFLQFHNLENNNETLHKYIKFGGLPYLINLPFNEAIIYEYLKNIYNSIILKDIVSRYNIRNLHLFDNLIHYLAGNFGTILSAKNISDFLKSQKLDYSSKVILEYLKYIENAFFISRARRFDIQGNRIFEIGDKFYFSDLGLRNTIIPYKTNDINLVLENLVHNHLLVAGFKVYVGKLGTNEIDFVAERNGEKLYIQVAYIIADANVYQREFGNLLQIKDNFPKYVVSMDEITGNSPEGIIHLNIKDFLVKEF